MEKWTVRKKIFFAITGICLALISLVTVCYSYIYIKNNISGILIDKQNESVILSKSVDKWIEKNESVMMRLFYDEELASICSCNGNDNLYLLKMDEYLRKLYAANDGVFAISFMDNSGRKCAISSLDYETMNSFITYYYEAAIDAENDTVWDVISTPYGNKIIMARQIYQLDTYLQRVSYGVFMFMINEDEIYELYSDTVPVYNSRIYVINGSDKILSGSEKDEAGRTISELYSDNGDTLTDMNGKRYYVLNSERNKADWHVMIAVPRREVYRGLYDTARTAWIIAAISFFIAILLAVVIARSIEVPINILADNLDDVIKNNFSAKLHIRTDRTTQRLVDSYNKMLDRLNELINNNLSMELRNKEAQLQAYEMQINPHFIYNTLDMIRMMAVMDDPENIDEAVLCLSSLLRFNNRMEKEVLIDEEIENIEYYFRILKLRYGDDFDYEIDVSAEIRSCYTLKFLLQPIAENAVKHGLEKSERKGNIKIMARMLNDEIILLIKDNGIGIDKARLDELKKRIYSSDGFRMSGKSIGMINVHQRIRLFYGERFGLDITSLQNEKTVVSIHIPVRRLKEENESQDPV